MNTKQYLFIGAALIIGITVGSVATYASVQPFKNKPSRGMHQMSDGSMMDDAHMTDSKKTMKCSDGNCAHMQESNDASAMHTSMMDMTTRMKGKSGAELDRVFLEDMIIHHQGAVDMAVLLKAGTNRSELKNMADDIITVQTKEIEMMKNWQKQWFSN